MVTYRDLQREYQTYEIYPKNLPIDDVDQSLTESEIIEYRKRMEMVNLTIKISNKHWWLKGGLIMENIDINLAEVQKIMMDEINKMEGNGELEDGDELKLIQPLVDDEIVILTYSSEEIKIEVTDFGRILPKIDRNISIYNRRWWGITIKFKGSVFLNKVFAFISSYLPLYVLLMINIVNYEKSIYYWIILTTLILLIIISIIVLLVYLVGKGGQLFLEENIQIDRFRSDKLRNDCMYNYLLVYFVILLTFNKNNNVMLMITSLIIFAFIGVLYVKANMIYSNIVLLLLGYVPYISTETGNIYIVNFDIDKLVKKSHEGTSSQSPTIKATIIGNGVVLVRKQDNIFS